MNPTPQSEQTWPSDFEAQTNIPLYHSWLLISVSSDMNAARAKFNDIFGKDDEDDEESNNRAFVVESKRGKFAIFFKHESLDHGSIAHEVYHLTSLIMNYIGQDFDPDNHESHAYLHGWLTNWVYGRLIEHGEIIQLANLDGEDDEPDTKKD